MEDLTDVTINNTPKRFVEIAKYLTEVDPTQLNALDPTSKAFYDHCYEFSGVPLVVKDLAAIDGTGKATITWTDDNTGPDVDSYKVFYKVGCAGTETKADILASTEFTGTKDPAGTDITDVGGAGTKMGIVVAGVNEIGIGPYTDPVFVDIAVSAVPGTPTALSGEDGTGKATITWTDHSPASTSYKVFYLTGAIGTENLAAVLAGTEFEGTKSPEGTDITASGTKVAVVVAGVNAIGDGEYAGPIFVDVA